MAAVEMIHVERNHAFRAVWTKWRKAKSALITKSLAPCRSKPTLAIQNHFHRGNRHDLVAGLGYRRNTGTLTGSE
jgi:hypothetical protein